MQSEAGSSTELHSKVNIITYPPVAIASSTIGQACCCCFLPRLGDALPRDAGLSRVGEPRFGLLGQRRGDAVVEDSTRGSPSQMHVCLMHLWQRLFTPASQVATPVAALLTSSSSSCRRPADLRGDLASSSAGRRRPELPGGCLLRCWVRLEGLREGLDDRSLVPSSCRPMLCSRGERRETSTRACLGVGLTYSGHL